MTDILSDERIALSEQLCDEHTLPAWDVFQRAPKLREVLASHRAIAAKLKEATERERRLLEALEDVVDIAAVREAMPEWVSKKCDAALADAPAAQPSEAAIAATYAAGLTRPRGVLGEIREQTSAVPGGHGVDSALIAIEAILTREGA